MESLIDRISRIVSALILVAVLGLTAVSVRAQANSGSLTPAPSAAASEPQPAPESPTAATAGTLTTRAGVQTGVPIQLALDDAIRRVLLNNNAIEITRDDVRIQEQRIRAELGFYDPVFNLNPTFSRNSGTGRSGTHDFAVNANMTHFIRPGGGNYQVLFNNNRTENAFAQAQVTGGNFLGTSTSAVYATTFGVRYNQPLMRNFRIDAQRRNLKISQRILQQTDADFRRTTIDAIAQVQRTYWDLVFALRDQQNRVANLNLAQENLRQVEARIAAGASAPLDRAQVATELANRESDLLAATQQVSITENLLKQLIIKDAIDSSWSQSILPTDRPVFSPVPLDMDAAIKDAMDNRFELRRLRLARDINSIDIAYFKDQKKPQVDLNTFVSLDGIARSAGVRSPFTAPLISGDPSSDASAFLLQQIRRFHTIDPVPVVEIPATQNYLVGGFNRSFVNIFRPDAMNYQIGVTISFPWRNRTAKANLAAAEITRNQIDSQTRQQEQQIFMEVRNAVQSVETARQQVLSSRRARENAEIQLEGEKQLFEAGRSTTFLLFQRENALTAARNAEIRAETNYSKALADLQKATSTTFEINNITVESPTNDR